MKIIGAGFGRTGTMSLMAAFEQLGFGPVYHFKEIVFNARESDVWLEIVDGQPVDWDKTFGRYNAFLDYPMCLHYKELLATYPDAKVILSVRDMDRWYDSTLQTIFQLSKIPRWLTIFPPFFATVEIANLTIWDGLYGGRFEDRAHAIALHEKHVAEVKATVPAEQLLVFRPSDGWEPLCDFLGVPVPENEFPHLNDRHQVQQLVKFLNGAGRLLPAALLAVPLAFWRIHTRRKKMCQAALES